MPFPPHILHPHLAGTQRRREHHIGRAAPPIFSGNLFSVAAESFVEDRLLRGILVAEAHPGVVAAQAAGRRRIELGLRGDVSH